MFLVLVFFSINIFSQVKKIKQFEISIYHSLSISHSKLSTKKEGYSSPPNFNLEGFGLKIQKLISYNKPNMFLTYHIGGMDLSTSGKFSFFIPKDSLQTLATDRIGSKRTFIERYSYYSVGLKKINRVEKKMNFNVELGVRLLVNVKSNREKQTFTVYTFNDEIIEREIIFEKSRKFTLLPYLSSGFDYRIGKFKIGFQLWIQNSFIEMTKFDYKVKRNNVMNYDGKIRSTGLAWGNNFYIVLKTF